MARNQRGISAIEVFLILLILTVVAGAIWGLTVGTAEREAFNTSCKAAGGTPLYIEHSGRHCAAPGIFLDITKPKPLEIGPCWIDKTTGKKLCEVR